MRSMSRFLAVPVGGLLLAAITATAAQAQSDVNVPPAPVPDTTQMRETAPMQDMARMHDRMVRDDRDMRRMHERMMGGEHPDDQGMARTHEQMPCHPAAGSQPESQPEPAR